MGELTPELVATVGTQPVAKAEAIPVQSYRRLMEHVAQLSYANKDYLLFFRGQATDYKNKAGASSFYPSVYRGERLSRAELAVRFDILTSASSRLVDAFAREGIVGTQEVRRRRYIQWSILQHYEVCPTPLLDFTHSVRGACSFVIVCCRQIQN
ncbi:MAG: FRG domain-containing protein, partial [Gammaproteobacteria bacterium]